MIAFTLRWMLVLGLALVAALFARADDPKFAEKTKEADDPLPKGAKVRFGSSRMFFRYTPAVAFVPPDYKTFLVRELTGGLRRYEASTGRPLDGGGAETTLGGRVVVSADGKRATNGGLTVREVGTGAEIFKLTSPAGFESGTAPDSISADGKVLAQCGKDKDGKQDLVVLDVDKNQVLARIPLAFTGIAVPTLSADGKVVAIHAASISRGGPTPAQPLGDTEHPGRTVQVWDVASKKELFKVLPHGGSWQGDAVAFSPDGATLAASTGIGPIDLWEVRSGKPLRTLLGRIGQGVRVAFSPDSKSVAGVASDGTIQRWSVTEGKLLGTTEVPVALPGVTVNGLGFASDDRVVAWGTSGMGLATGMGSVVVAWEAPSGKLLTPVGDYTSGIYSIGFGKGGNEIVTAGIDGRIVRWDAATGKRTETVIVRRSRSQGFHYQGGQPFSMIISPDAARCFSTGYLPAAVYDLSTGTELFGIPGDVTIGNSGISGYQFPSADFSKVVSLSLSGGLKGPPACVVWDIVGQKKIVEIDMPGAASGITPAVSFSPDGTRLVVATSLRLGASGPVTVTITGWNLKTGKKLSEIEAPNSLGAITLAAANNTSAVVSSGKRLWAVDYEAGRAGDEIENLRNSVEGPSGPVVFSPDGTRFATGVPSDRPGTYGVRVYDWPRGTPLHTFTGHTAPISALTFSRDGKYLASGSQDTTVLLWDMSLVQGGK